MLNFLHLSFAIQNKSSNFAARMDMPGHYEIDFGGITADGMDLTWDLDDSFFSALDQQEISHGKLAATLRVKKKAAAYVLDIHVCGNVEIQCDRCLEPMSQPIDAHESIEVRLGDTFDDDGERILLPEDKPVLDVAWNLYETIALAIPVFHVHPEGLCSQDLSQYIVATDEPASPDSEDDVQRPTDSRWDALKGLLDNSQQDSEGK